MNYLGEVTIAPITTAIRDIPSEVFLSQANGMLRDCAISDHATRTWYEEGPLKGPVIYQYLVNSVDLVFLFQAFLDFLYIHEPVARYSQLC